MRSHFGRFLQYFAEAMETGSVPDFYIVRVQSLLESAKLLLPRLDGNRRSKYKARLRIIWADLELFKSDSFTIMSERCDRLQDRVRVLEEELGKVLAQAAILPSSPPVLVQGKSVKCHGCQLILHSDSFSRTQLGKPRGRKCQACLSSNTIC